MSSYGGAIPIESEAKILIDSCLAHVREDARLDDEPVLPSLDVIRRKDRDLVFPAARPLPTAVEIVRRSAKTVKKKRARPAFLTQDRPLVPSEPTITRPMTRLVRRLRWPVMLCGFLAGVFAGAAFMTSPAGHKPRVQHVVTKAKTTTTSMLAVAHLARH